MSEETKEALLTALEGAANFLNGAMFDTRLPKDMIEAFGSKAEELEDIVEKYLAED